MVFVRLGGFVGRALVLGVGLPSGCPPVDTYDSYKCR